MGGRGLVGLLASCVACGGSGSSTSVDAPNGPPDAATHTITVTLIDRPNTPTTFTFLTAYEDGTGPWHAAPAPSGDTYSFEVASATWSFAWTCIAADSREVMMYSFTVAERSSLTDQIFSGCTDRNPAPVSLSGAISNAPAAGTIEVDWADQTVAATGSSYAFAPGVPPGTHDLVATHRTATGTGSYIVDSALVQTGVAVTATTTQAINFATAVATRTAAITGAPSNAFSFMGLETAGGTFVTLALSTTQPTGGYQVVGLAASQEQSGDLYDTFVEQPTGGGSSLSVERFTSAPTALAFVAPAPLVNVSSSVAATMPYLRVASTWTPYSGATGYTWSLDEPLTGAACGASSTCDVAWEGLFSPGAVGSSPRIEVPDLSAIPGWDPRLELQPGAKAALVLSGSISTGGPSDFPFALTPPDGTTRTHAHSAAVLSL
jgi:hypothetical protein